jgi:hypothetical protein
MHISGPASELFAGGPIIFKPSSSRNTANLKSTDLAVVMDTVVEQGDRPGLELGKDDGDFLEIQDSKGVPVDLGTVMSTGAMI